MITCFLGLGSNLRSPERQLRQAVRALRTMPKTKVIQVSKLYFNPAVGRRGQPSYCNSVVKIRTSLPPIKLLNLCLTIEKKQQRVRKIRWGSRTLDIDILLYGDKTIRHHRLHVPHPRMQERDFVQLPLLSITN